MTNLFGLQLQESTGSRAPPRVKITRIWSMICVDWQGEWPIGVQIHDRRVTSGSNRPIVAMNRKQLWQTTWTKCFSVSGTPNLSTRSLSTDIDRGRRSSLFILACFNPVYTSIIDQLKCATCPSKRYVWIHAVPFKTTLPALLTVCALVIVIAHWSCVK